MAIADARTTDLPEVAVRIIDSDPDLGPARIWLLDVAGNTLTDVRRPEVCIPVADTPEGEAARRDHTVTSDRSTHLPISLRGHALGVLSLHGPDTRGSLSRALPVATLLAQELVGSDRYSDNLGRYRHEQQLSVSATMQRTLLPLLNYRDDVVEVVGRLEPAYEVAGDVYDYAVNPEGIHLAILDAVGHDLRSTTLSSLAVGAYRRSRRAGAPLKNIAAEIDGAVATYDRRIDFVTGLVARYEPGPGLLHLCNAGHHEPLRIRDGTVTDLSPARRHRPFGLGVGPGWVDTFEVEPGDLVAFYTDGVIEARDPKRRQWGLRRLRDTLRDGSRADLDHLTKSVLDTVVAYVGDTLSDDAALLLVRPARS